MITEVNDWTPLFVALAIFGVIAVGSIIFKKKKRK